ncbi:SMUG2 DNA glycosylase family protein [Pedobacter immunditicola]|uniref:SMUG2 DNA glycosylase family protein n=1 Tax=Pedobacter immunditicola TaxID=3133440 RepID=UPI0030A9A306
MKTVGEKIISFNKKINYTGKLPEGYGVLNPFGENSEAVLVMEKFYRKFYNDHHNRKFIIGINPSRHGAGLTGVPFTDTKRLDQVCGIQMQTVASHEISSVFMYDMIAQYGGVDKFYSRFYINSPFPLAIVKANHQDKLLNANYYDDNTLFEMVKPFMTEMLKQQIEFGLITKKVYVLGKRNALFLNKINKTEKLFGQLITLEHPRFIQQYKLRYKNEYIDKYLTLLDAADDAL